MVVATSRARRFASLPKRERGAIDAPRLPSWLDLRFSDAVEENARAHSRVQAIGSDRHDQLAQLNDALGFAVSLSEVAGSALATGQSPDQRDADIKRPQIF
jgi:hypothetical protein